MIRQDVRLRRGLIVLLAISLAACPLALAQQVSFAQPQQSQPQPFTPPPANFVNPFTQTAAIPTPLSALTGALPESPFISMEEGSIWRPSYKRVVCGAIDDDICYELCYGGSCATYGDNDGRVARFVEKIDELEDKIRELELLRADRGKAIFDAGAICVKAGSGAALAYAAIVGLVAPEPTVTKVVGAVAAVGAGIACVGSIYSAWRVEGSSKRTRSRKSLRQVSPLRLNSRTYNRLRLRSKELNG